MGKENVKAARATLLDTWLEKQEAQCRWQQRVPRVGVMECWILPNVGKILHVMRYQTGGWDVYVPASDAISGVATLAAVEQRFGLPST